MKRCQRGTANETQALSPLFNEYREYRRAHNGVAESTLTRDLDVAQRFHLHLRDRRRTIRTPRLVDLDAFVSELGTRVSKPTVADDCSSLRSFLRFLQTTGRVNAELAKIIVTPRVRKEARPPRTLPWQDVKRILRSIGRSEPPGKRDFAILLLLATYGLGAAEVLGKCLRKTRRAPVAITGALSHLPVEFFLIYHGISESSRPVGN